MLHHFSEAQSYHALWGRHIDLSLISMCLKRVVRCFPDTKKAPGYRPCSITALVISLKKYQYYVSCPRETLNIKKFTTNNLVQAETFPGGSPAIHVSMHTRSSAINLSKQPTTENKITDILTTCTHCEQTADQPSKINFQYCSQNEDMNSFTSTWVKVQMTETNLSSVRIFITSYDFTTNTR